MSTSSSTASAPSALRSFDYADVAPGRGSGTSDDMQKQIVAAAVCEAEARAKAAFAEQLARERDVLRSALADFARERQLYFRKVESEVLQLALAIARKILQREARVDTLLLAGLVRLALENIHSSTRVVVRIHPTQAASWREYFAQNIDPPDVPDIIEDPAVEAGRCILQTSVGTTQLGIEPQLKEIEQGLLDLLAQKPQTG